MRCALTPQIRAVIPRPKAALGRSSAAVLAPARAHEKVVHESVGAACRGDLHTAITLLREPEVIGLVAKGLDDQTRSLPLEDVACLSPQNLVADIFHGAVLRNRMIIIERPTVLLVRGEGIVCLSDFMRWQEFAAVFNEFPWEYYVTLLEEHLHANQMFQFDRTHDVRYMSSLFRDARFLEGYEMVAQAMGRSDEEDPLLDHRADEADILAFFIEHLPGTPALSPWRLARHRKIAAQNGRYWGRRLVFDYYASTTLRAGPGVEFPVYAQFC